MKNLLETLEETGTFTTLINAVKKAGLEDALAGGPFTILAPNDVAFSKIDKSVLNQFLEDNEKLTALLLYHVLPEKLKAEDLRDSRNLTTLQGKDLQIQNDGVRVTIDSAQLIQADIESSNGVIHVLDTVLIPK